MNDCHEKLDIWSITTTVGSLEDARALARELVGRRLAACVQVEAIAASIYRWDGKLQEDPEFRLVIKTTGARRVELEAAFAELHPYELPQFTGTPVAASDPYAAWVRSETA